MLLRSGQRSALQWIAVAAIACCLLLETNIYVCIFCQPFSAGSMGSKNIGNFFFLFIIPYFFFADKTPHGDWCVTAEHRLSRCDLGKYRLMQFEAWPGRIAILGDIWVLWLSGRSQYARFCFVNRVSELPPDFWLIRLVCQVLIIYIYTHIYCRVFLACAVKCPFEGRYAAPNAQRTIFARTPRWAAVAPIARPSVREFKFGGTMER